jgi:hypothetical protein
MYQKYIDSGINSKGLDNIHKNILKISDYEVYELTSRYDSD